MLCQNCGQPVVVRAIITYDIIMAEDFTQAANADDVMEMLTDNIHNVTAELFCLCQKVRVSEENQDRLLAFFDEIA